MMTPEEFFKYANEILDNTPDEVIYNSYVNHVQETMKLAKIKERLDSFLDLTPDEDWPHQYHAEEINSYYEIVEYLFSDIDIDPLIYPIADGGIALQYEKGNLLDGIEINTDSGFISYLCYDKENEVFIDSFEVPLTLDSQTLVKDKIKKNHETEED